MDYLRVKYNMSLYLFNIPVDNYFLFFNCVNNIVIIIKRVNIQCLILNDNLDNILLVTSSRNLINPTDRVVIYLLLTYTF